MSVIRFSTMRRPVLVLFLILTVAYFVVVKFFYKYPFSLSYFHDMRDDAYSWAAPDAEWMNDHGFMKGVDDWDFAPGRPITRAEFCALLLKVRDIDVDHLKNVPAPNSRFKDLDQKAWYPAVVEKADQMHILPFPVDNDQFKPDAPVTRAEVAQAIADLFHLKPTNQSVNLADIKGNPHEDAIKAVYQHSYITGTTNGEFKPNDVATRAVVARMFHLALADQRPELNLPNTKEHQTQSNSSQQMQSTEEGGSSK
jgi:hypothetical protein